MSEGKATWGKRVEQWYPFVGGLLVALSYYAMLDAAVPSDLGNILAMLVSICSIAIGFLGTALSVLLSLGDRRIVRQLKDAGEYQNVSKYIMRAINLWFVLAVASAAALFAGLPKSADMQTASVLAGVGLAAWSVLASHRVVRLLGVILDRPH